MPDDTHDLTHEQGVFDNWDSWSRQELPNRRQLADRAYKRALVAGDEAAWQHAEIMERSYGQLSDMITHQDPYFARIRGRMKDVDGELFTVDLRVHRYHRSESFPTQGHEEVLDISHLAPLGDLVRNPQQRELQITLSDREFLQWTGSTSPRIEVLESAVEDIELENGRVTRVAPRYGAIFEDRVRRRLKQSAMPALDVLADVLDEEQNAIVGNRAAHLRLFILDGPAGTGKTVVAAHRIAVAESPDSHGLYLTPTTTLRDYVKPVLPRLGLERARAQALSLVDLAAMMWPDLPWNEDLSGTVPDLPWSRDEWDHRLTQFARESPPLSMEALYRRSSESLGRKPAARFGPPDAVPLLWLGAKLGRPHPVPMPQWIIVDEAQAIPVLAYEALRQWLGNRISWVIAGDLMQQGTRHDWDGWKKIQTALGLEAGQTALLWLSRSYRVPPKIHAAAERLRSAVHPQAKASESVPWHPHPGEVVVTAGLTPAAMGQEAHAVVEKLRAGGLAAMAILVPDAHRQAAWKKVVDQWRLDCQLLDGRLPYRGGLVLTQLESVRGLEFDAVILVDCDASHYPENAWGARQLYTSLTRARRSAYLLASDTPSPWLEVLRASNPQRTPSSGH